MHHFEDHPPTNDSANPTLHDIIAARGQARRNFVKTASGAALAALLPPLARAQAPATPAPRVKIGFTSIPAHYEDKLALAPGYTAEVLYAWGDALSPKSAPFKKDASNTAAEQMLQAGMHTDGMHFFPLPDGKDKLSSTRGILCVNHEYIDDGLLHPGGFENWSAEKVAKGQAAVGVSVIEIARKNSKWAVQLASRYNRRVTAHTVCDVGGPARGSDLMRSQTDPTGQTVKGNYANCAHGITPWGTYLACEENFHGYFAARESVITDRQKRYGLTKNGSGYRWADFDKRFETGGNPNEFHHFGWVVEIDPFEPGARPVKRTALGRFRHESATMTVAPDQRVVFYSGDDSVFEYLYKFVTAKPWNPKNRAANKHLLDEGTLYVARFNADGSGEWLPLVHGMNGLTADNGFSSQADVLVHARQAGDAVGATKLDRPEWITVHPVTREVYCSLTNNSERGEAGKPGTDAVNRRANNIMGSIVRWREAGDDATATRFQWDVFIEGGDPAQEKPHHQGNVKGDLFACPDGLWFDPNGILWIETDASAKQMTMPEWKNLGGNQMLACDPSTREVRRFLVGPRNCEVTGVIMTPDCKTLFVGIQHPGETPSERSDPARPTRFSMWPDMDPDSRPRSAVIAIRKNDGGVIGT